MKSRRKKYYWKVTRKDGYSSLVNKLYYNVVGVFYRKNCWSYQPKKQGELFVFRTRKEARLYKGNINFVIHKAKIGKIIQRFTGKVIDGTKIINNCIFTDKVMLLD